MAHTERCVNEQSNAVQAEQDRTFRGRSVVLGVPFDRLTLSGAIDRIVQWTRTDRSYLVVTPNPEIVEAARRDPQLMDILHRADLSLADGVGIVWAAKRVGNPVPERVTGIDLFLGLLERAPVEGLRIYFVGGRPEVVSAAAATARQRYGADVVGYHHGYLTTALEEPLLADIRRKRPHLLFTGMGSPRDQMWCMRHRDALGPVVCIGVGGSFDVLAGKVRRAPIVWRKLRLEWLFRLVQQPSRWRRQLLLPLFVWHVLTGAGSAPENAEE